MKHNGVAYQGSTFVIYPVNPTIYPVWCAGSLWWAGSVNFVGDKKIDYFVNRLGFSVFKGALAPSKLGLLHC